MVRLDDIELLDGCRQITYEHEWREGFVGEALSIVIGRDKRVVSIEFYTSEVGVVRWMPGTGFDAAKQWGGSDDGHTSHRLAKKASAWLSSAGKVEANEIAEQVLDKMHDRMAREFVEVQLKWSGEALRWFEKKTPDTVHRKSSVLMPR